MFTSRQRRIKRWYLGCDPWVISRSDACADPVVVRLVLAQIDVLADGLQEWGVVKGLQRHVVQFNLWTLVEVARVYPFSISLFGLLSGFLRGAFSRIFR